MRKYIHTLVFIFKTKQAYKEDFMGYFNYNDNADLQKRCDN